jgi:DeoR/GlpR family transcriptional regulator of sugar metabolism
VAGHLQVAVGMNNIKLPCGKFADLLGVSKMTISRYRKWAEEDGFIKQVRGHKYRPNGVSDATEYRFAVHRWKCLEVRAASGAAEAFERAYDLSGYTDVF